MFFQKLKQRSYEAGLEEGKIQGYQIAINEINKYIDNKDKESEEQELSDLTIFNNIDGVMLWLKAIVEIKDTDFLKNMYFMNNNSKEIKSYIDFIDEMSVSAEAKLLYPYVHYYIPELRPVFDKIYRNKLAIEEAEKLF